MPFIKYIWDIGMPKEKYWDNMLCSAKRYQQIFTDKREKNPRIFLEFGVTI